MKKKRNLTTSFNQALPFIADWYLSYLLLSTINFYGIYSKQPFATHLYFCRHGAAAHTLGIMPKITFCGLLFQLHIKWETSYYWYHSCVLWRHTDVCFLSSKYSHGSVGTGVFVVVLAFLTGTWLAAGDLTPRTANIHQMRFQGRKLRFWSMALERICCNEIQAFSVCDSFSQLNGNWLKARWTSVLFFPHWIKRFFWFLVALPCTLSLNPPLSADVRWCWISFKSWVQAGYHILDANVMVISQRATHRRTDKKKHTLLLETRSVLGCL